MERGVFGNMGERWSSPWVARTEIERFSGGIISEKYLANLDSKGNGPAGRVRCGRKIVYPVASVITWLNKRIAPIDVPEQVSLRRGKRAGRKGGGE